MKNEITTIHSDVDPNILSALQNTLYPGADAKSIDMVLSYCKALKLDPMQKPVHLVPMNSKNADGSWGKRNIVMPGIGLYRIQASRSGSYAGMTEPEFGEDITEKIGNKNVTYPKWCKVTVKKILDGHIVEFSAKEYWKENYAVVGGKEKDPAPNSMWEKRPYGQLAKCAEAQALRKAFPEIIGSHPTAEEMEGKTINEIKDITPQQAKIEPRPTDVFQHPTEFEFVHLDDEVTKKMDANEVVGYLRAKILNIKTEEDLESYSVWKALNSRALVQFAKENYRDASDLSSIFETIKASINKVNTENP